MMGDPHTFTRIRDAFPSASSAAVARRASRIAGDTDAVRGASRERGWPLRVVELLRSTRVFCMKITRASVATIPSDLAMLRMSARDMLASP